MLRGKFSSGQQIAHPTGNWKDFRDDTDGDTDWDLDQDRVHNKANEIDTDDVHGNGPGASITATTGTNWGDPLYDANGNATLLPKPGDPANSFTFEYDAWNRLIVVKTNGVFLHAAYLYDGLNRRTLKYHSGGLTDHCYYSNRWQVLEQQDYQGDTENQYVWGLRYVDDLAVRDYDYDGNPATGDLGIEDSGLERRRFAMQDAQFNLVAGVSTTGVVQERFTYTPYGAPEFRNQYFAPSTNTQNWQTLYAGYRYDPETGLYHVRNRYYHAQLGRFVNRDPIEADINPYRYCTNNALSRTDPNGLDDTTSFPGREVVWTGHLPHFYKYTDQWGRRVYDPPLSVKTAEEARQYYEGRWWAHSSPGDSSLLPRGYEVAHWGDVVIGHYKSADGFIPITRSELTLRSHIDSALDEAFVLVLLAIGEAIPGPADEEAVLSHRIIRKLDAPANARGPVVGGGARVENLTPAAHARIQAFVDSHGANVTVVGSRAGGTYGPLSDFDYLIGGNSKLRASARWQLPRGPAGGAVGPRGETGIDIFNQNNVPLDPTKPHIIFRPRPGGGC